jgi:NADPH-dependent 2,4-dienoyl-CoA reductase/sulfur reductase-like enzyme/nitrite reductase/ring-hydroxylating ferredoxin subunit
MGGEPAKLEGPDLAAGIEDKTLAQGVPLKGHAHGEAVMLVRSGNGVFAVGATCTHYSGPLAEGLVVGDTVRCPWHHACFDLRTGAVVGAPALNPVACFEVERQGTLLKVGKRQPAPTPSPVAVAAAATAGVKDVVIVGAGAAGHSAAEALRAAGYAGNLTLVGGDLDPPYDRPNLSKDYLAGTAPEEWMPLRPREHYTEQRIALETGATVTAIDPAAHEVALSDGRKLVFDRLLLAPGADPIRLQVPGADAAHVHVLRSMEDCRRLIAGATKAKQVVIVGAGFIGLEAAAALRARNLEVTVVAPEAAPLTRVVGPEVGAFLRRLHEEHGVTFHLGETAGKIEPDAVVTAKGTRIPADLVLVAIGVRPSVALATSAGIATDGGILVDRHLETSVPGIFAAGDAARFPDPRSKSRIRVEHWVVAQRMGAAAGRNMLGARRPFTDVPFFWSTQYDVTLNYVGHADDGAAIEIDGKLDDRDCRVSFRNDGRLSAVLTIGRDRESLESERLLETSDPG